MLRNQFRIVFVSCIVASSLQAQENTHTLGKVTTKGEGLLNTTIRCILTEKSSNNAKATKSVIFLGLGRM